MDVKHDIAKNFYYKKSFERDNVDFVKVMLRIYIIGNIKIQFEVFNFEVK